MHFTAKYLSPENFIMMVIFKNMIQGLYQNSKLSHPTFSGKKCDGYRHLNIQTSPR